MKKKLAKWVIAAVFAPFTSGALGGEFTPGNLVIYRVGDGSASLANTGNAVFLDEYTPAGTLVQSVALPTVASGANKPLVASGTATSEGLLTLSADGHYLMLTGYGAALPNATSLAGSTVASTPRVIGRVDALGNIDTSTALTDWSDKNNPRSAVSTDGTNIWAGGAAGGVIYTTLGSTTSTQISSTVANIRQVNIFGGQLYASTSSGSTLRLGSVGSGVSNTTGQTITQLPGLPTSGSPYNYFLADLDSNTPGLDTLYLADDTTANGEILKYSLSGGSWIADGAITAAGIRGLVGSVSGTTVTLYGTTGGSAAAGGGTLYGFTDTTGYNSAASGTASTLATAATNEAFRGIAFVPTAIVTPEPALLGLIVPAGLLLARSRRRALR